MNLPQFANAATIGSLCFLAILILSKKSNTSIGYRFLSLVFFLLAFIFADELFESTGAYIKYSKLIVVFQPLIYAFPPLIYLAVYYLTTVEKKLSLKVFFHFVPYLLLISLYLSVYVINTPRQAIRPDDDSNDKAFEIFLLFLFFIQVFSYLYLSIKQLKKHQLTLPLFVSNISDNDYHWLYKATIGLSMLAVISFTEFVFDQAHISFYFSFIYLIGFYYIGVQVTRQNDVFPFSKDQRESVADLINGQQSFEDKKIHTENILINIAESKEDLSGNLIDRKQVISEEKLEQHKARLIALMLTEKPYLDSAIALPKIAGMLSLNTYQTSYLINTCFSENFYVFINRYRLEECKRMLMSPEYAHLSILAIAFESGFNSKTAFNTSFKKSIGLSPKEFKEQVGKIKVG